MLNREKIEDAISYTLKFLDDKWDSALLGYAESGGAGRYVLPCYGYQAMKAVLRDNGYDGANTYSILQKLYSEMPTESPLILTKLNRRSLWKEANRLKFMRWETLDSAVIGIGKIKYKTTGLVYSKPLCVNVLSKTSKKSGTIEKENIISAIRKLEEELMPVDAKSYTPWYLTPIR